MDRSKARIVREKIDAALALLSKELGMAVRTIGGGSFTPTALMLKIEAAEIGSTGEVQSQQASDYKQYAPWEGLPAGTLGWTFTSKGQQYIIAGYNMRAKTMPIVCTSGGKSYKFRVAGLKAVLAAQHPEEWAEVMKTLPASAGVHVR